VPEAHERRTIAEITELAGGLAHELRNPLSTLMINLKLLAEDLGDGSARPADVRRRGLLRVDVLRREAGRLQALLDDFLHLTGPRRLRKDALDLNDVVARLVQFFRPQAQSAGIDVKTQPASASVICSVDEMLLRQALLNIVINAQEAMPRGGTLEISTERYGDWASISVSDTGMGIAEENRDNLLRPFYSTKARGNGLGLAITQRIIDDHGGNLTWESEIGKGTTFVIRLPLASSRDHNCAGRT